MIKKLYYTCPLEAAYMAKNFGVKFVMPGLVSANLVNFGMSCLSDIPYKFFDYDGMEIHPDSLSIFEPQLGDIIDYSREWESISKVRNDFASDGGCSLEFAIKEIKNGKAKIIQRNNKPFIMPQQEQENADKN